MRVQVLVTDRVQGKQLYMPMNSTKEPVNRLTSSHTDRATHTPAFKETAVKMTVLPEQGENPLPRQNFRYGTADAAARASRWSGSGRERITTCRAREPDDKLVQIKSTTV